MKITNSWMILSGIWLSGSSLWAQATPERLDAMRARLEQFKIVSQKPENPLRSSPKLDSLGRGIRQGRTGTAQSVLDGW
jgi:hypothetical protein